MVFLPYKKLQALLWKSNLRHRRMPSTIQDCIDDNPPREGSYRLWLATIIVLALIYYVYYAQMTNNRTIMILNDMELADTTSATQTDGIDDVEVVVAEGNETCGYGCNVESLSNRMKTKINDLFKDTDDRPPCEITMLGRGKIQVNLIAMAGNVSNTSQPLVRLGGYHTPLDCRSRHKVAVIVPYRDNEVNLRVFLFNIHPFLINQNIEYQIFVVEQSGREEFNKGSLVNAGFKQVHHFGKWSCLVFHDVDLLPLDERILYTCPTYPRQMSTTVLGHRNDTKYKRFGGVAAMSVDHFLKVNGFSNSYWGCCGVDSDMFLRIRLAGLRVVRYDRRVARYLALPQSTVHNNTDRNPRVPLPGRTQNRDDGLSTVQYKVITIRLRSLFTHILVDLNPKLPSSQIRSWGNKIHK